MGCNHTVSKRDYYQMMGYELQKAAKKEKPVVSGAGAGMTAGKGSSESSATKGVPVPLERNVSAMHPKAENWEQKIFDEAASIKVDADRFPQYAGYNSYEIIETILKALVHISEKRYYSLATLAGVLSGSQADEITRYKLYTISEYNALSHMAREDISLAIHWLIEKHYILKTKDRYPVLHITNEGLHYKEHLTPRSIKSFVAMLGKGENGEPATKEDI